MFWIGDTITRINNAIILKKRNVKVKATKYVVNVLEVLKKENFISDYAIENDLFKTCVVSLNYYNNHAVIQKLNLISKPSRRVYVSYQDLLKRINNFSTPILSTSIGVISAKEAYLKKVGGEFICEVK